MPFGFLFSEPAQTVYITASGDLDLEMCIETLGKIVDHPDFQPHYGIVANFKSMESAPAKAEIRSVASVLRKHKDSFDGNIALVLNKEHLILAGMLCMLVRVFGMRMEAFDNIPMAMEFASSGTKTKLTL